MLKSFNKLSDLLNQPASQERALTTMRAARTVLADDPVIRAAKATLDAIDPAEDAIAAVADLDWEDVVRSVVLGNLRAMGDEPLYAPPLSVLDDSSFKGFVLLDHPAMLVSVIACDPTEFVLKKRNPAQELRSLAFSATDSYLRFIKAGGLTISRWSCPLFTDETVASDAIRCTRTSEQLLADGDVVRLAGGTQTMVFERCDSGFVMLQLIHRRPRSPVVPEFEAVEGRLIACSAADQKSSRIQMLSTLTRLLGAEGMDETYEALSRHADHFVRWHVMREWLARSPGRAKQRLAEMARDDRNANVRRTADMTLRLFFKPQEEEA